MRTSLLLLLSFLFAAPAFAQGGFGIGGQIGEPTGLTMKFGTGRSAIDLAAEWDFDDYLFVQGHVLFAERRFVASPVGYFYGPGVFVGAREGRDAVFGLSLNLGINYYTGPIEIFGQMTPRLQLTEETDFDLGAALGLRFYP